MNKKGIRRIKYQDYLREFRLEEERLIIIIIIIK